MSISVTALTKVYGEQVAIDALDFTINEGEIIGFLGPNGAGKTTTMKILAGYIPATSGTATVYGFDVSVQADDVKQLIGYLPEHNPLYKEMYVREYLGLVAKIHKIANAKARIEEVIESTGLQLEAHKQIGTLSKGYRQRVGLAQAIIHNPKVLILDEPTSGLDPNQLVEIRQLIKTIGKDKIVIFSSHIMQEVQALCDRVLILNRGNLVADAPIQELVSRLSSKKIVDVEFENEVDSGKLQAIDGVHSISLIAPRRYSIFIEGDKDIRGSLFDFAVLSSTRLLKLNAEQQDMEDVFQQLTSNTKPQTDA